MNNKLTFQWGVVAGREVGTITKRFHKRRDSCPEARAIGKSHALPPREARRKLREAQRDQARRSQADKDADWIKLNVHYQRKLAGKAVKAQLAEIERSARMAEYNESIGE